MLDDIVEGCPVSRIQGLRSDYLRTAGLRGKLNNKT